MTPDDEGNGGPRAPSIPALRFPWLTRWYDPIVRATLRDDALKALLVAQAAIQPGQCVLDLGCGTATLTIMLKRACPDAHVVGLDDDPAVLAIAREKIASAGLDIDLCQGAATRPPFALASFDHVVSSLVFHHLTTDDKARALGSVYVLLRPGAFHLGDGGRPRNRLMRVAFLGIQLLDGFRTTGDTVRGRLIPLREDVGFASVAETYRASTVFGTFSLYRATRPGRPGRARPWVAALAWAARHTAAWPRGRAAATRGASL